MRAFYQMVNIINTIFLDKTQIEKNENGLKLLQTDSEHLKKGLFKFNRQNINFLVWSIIPYSYFAIDSIEKSFWVFHPVFTYFPQNTDKLDLSLPISLGLKNVEISKEGLVGNILNSDEKIIVIRVNDPKNLSLFENHEKLIVSSEFEVKQTYLHILEAEITFELVKFLYFECWQ